MNALRKEISIYDMKNIKIGQAENEAAGTGCTVFLCPEGMKAGLDVRGGGPASRESELLNPLAAAQVIHGIVLAGKCLRTGCRRWSDAVSGREKNWF